MIGWFGIIIYAVLLTISQADEDFTKLTCYGEKDADRIVGNLGSRPIIVGRPGKQGPAGPPGPAGDCEQSDCSDLKRRIENLEFGRRDDKVMLVQEQNENECNCDELPALKLRIEKLEKVLEETEKKIANFNRSESSVPQSCDDLKGEDRKTGVKTIYPFSKKRSLEVFCDFDTFQGPWLVFQRRIDGTTNFYRSWLEYVEGFGDKSKEFWLGLEYIHLITTQNSHILRVDLEDFEGTKAYAEYSEFQISSQKSEYTITAKGYSGTAGDGFSMHDGYKFSTKDRNEHSCAKSFKGAWWFRACHHAHLNGPYGAKKVHGHGIVWYEWKDHFESLKSAEMKMKPKSP